nr:probable aspartyl protease At4g16563 [Ipomoea batatas]
MILGLTRVTSDLSTPKSAAITRVKKSSESLDVMEPLREVRDGYLISLNLGTPPQIFEVYMDTGSDLTWVPCGNISFDCLDCDDYKNSKILGSFSPSRSSSSYRDSCASSFCVNVHSSDNGFDTCAAAGCPLGALLKGTCLRACPSFAYTYGDGVVSGTLTRDFLRVHGSSPNSSRDVPKFCFGCVGATYREPIGIAGFGKGPLSIPSQLGFLQKGFSHCFLAFRFANNPNVSSPLVVGDVAISSKDDLQFTPMLNSPAYPNYYYIGLEAITIGGSGTGAGGAGSAGSAGGPGDSSNAAVTVTHQVPLSMRNFDSSGNGGMLIDSGTTYTHLPEPLYSQLLSSLQSTIHFPRATEAEMRTGFDLCYHVPCRSNATAGPGGVDDDVSLPSITFHFLNNATLVLPQENHFYAMSAPTNSTQVKCLLFQSMNGAGAGAGDQYGGPAGIFGSFQQQNVEVVYDLEKERIGFRTTECALQGLHNI